MVAIIATATMANARDQVHVAGSSTVLPYAAIVAEAFGENFDFPTPIIESGGSGAGRKKLCDGVVDMASKNCKTFIARTFAQKLDIMRIADHFPQEGDFEIKPSMVVFTKHTSTTQVVKTTQF